MVRVCEYRYSRVQHVYMWYIFSYGLLYCIFCKCDKNFVIYYHPHFCLFNLDFSDWRSSDCHKQKKHLQHKWPDSSVRWWSWLMARSHSVIYIYPSLHLCLFTDTDIVKENHLIPTVNENEKKELLYVNWERTSCTLFTNKRNLSPVTFYSISVDKLLIVFPLSRMCCLCLTLPPPHGRWYNGCYESRSHFQVDKIGPVPLSQSTQRAELLLAIVLVTPPVL